MKKASASRLKTLKTGMPMRTEKEKCDMNVRRAEERDIPRIGELLLQVAELHAKARPDLFRAGQRKYTDEEFKAILRDPAPRCRRKTAFLFA